MSGGSGSRRTDAPRGLPLALLLPVAAASLRKRWTAFAGSFVALTLGVALIGATGLLTEAAADIESPDPAAPSLKKLLTFTAGVSGFVSVFVVASTFAFAVAARRRETALLRAVGATPRQVGGLVLGEALLVALVASGCGALLAPVLAPLLADWLVRRAVAPDGFSAPTTPGPLLTAVAVEAAVALLGAWAAARRAGRVRPTEALGQAAVDRGRTTAGRLLWAVLALAVAVTVPLLLAAMPEPLRRDPQLRDPRNLPDWALVCDLLAITTVALLAPLLVPPLVRLLTLPVRLSAGAVGLLARQNALTAVRRTVSTATPVFLVVALAGSVVGSTAAFAEARDEQTRAALRAEYVMEADGPKGIPPEFPLGAPGDRDEDATGGGAGKGTGGRLGAFGRMGGGDRMGLYVTAVADTPLTGLDGGSGDAAAGAAVTTATVVDGDITRAWELPAEAGSLADLKGPGTVAVSAGLAKSRHWRLGDRLTTGLADGTKATLRVVAVVRTPLSLSEVLVPYAAVAGHDRSLRAGTAYVSTDTRASVSFLFGVDPGEKGAGGVRVTPAEEWTGGNDSPQNRYLWIALAATLGPAVLYALIAVVNTMVMSTGDRLRDFATLRLTGGSDRQVLGMVAGEAVLTTATAAVLGLLVTLATQATTAWLYNRWIDGAAVPAFRLPWAVTCVAAGTCLVLALLASLVPARLALRGRALDAAGGRG
ncbi:FtsX-like permease family protein [Streptomyces sp. NPDC021100]|uniref:ABC transporter permease n=1 Tax=Streptomyces sp. NPDC021100 TaxID=3365114 RepID=UPI00379F6649